MTTKHKVGDLIIRPYFDRQILGIVRKINNRNIAPFQIEWITATDCDVSSYDDGMMDQGKRRLDEYLKSKA